MGQWTSVLINQGVFISEHPFIWIRNLLKTTVVMDRQDMQKIVYLNPHD